MRVQIKETDGPPVDSCVIPKAAVGKVVNEVYEVLMPYLYLATLWDGSERVNLS